MSRRTKISGLLLRELRKEAELTQHDLAARVGINRETVSATGNDKRETIKAIGAGVISKWHIICTRRASAATRNKLFGHLVKYFGFSEQHVIDMAKDIAKLDKQNQPPSLMSLKLYLLIHCIISTTHFFISLLLFLPFYFICLVIIQNILI